ncbi:hypothetical protein DL95DRAFT_399173, partial [Leptodontidium sp. 2 PMI_412]
MLLASRTSENFILEKASAMDLQITSLVWGITLGLGFLTTWKAIKQTTSITRRYGYLKLNSPYIWMIWIEILSCLGFSIMLWLYLNSYLKPWCEITFTEVQFLLGLPFDLVSHFSSSFV